MSAAEEQAGTGEQAEEARAKVIPIGAGRSAAAGAAKRGKRTAPVESSEPVQLRPVASDPAVVGPAAAGPAEPAAAAGEPGRADDPDTAAPSAPRSVADAVEVLRLASVEPRRGTTNTGTFNVAGDGVMVLSQAARRLGRPTVPMLLPAVSWVAGLARQTRLLDFSPEQMRLLTHGRVVDTTMLRETFGYTPGYTTEEALADLARSTRSGLLPPGQVARWTSRVAELLPISGGKRR